MERARWESLMYKLKDHVKLGDNIDLLISKLRQKQLLHSDVPGNTVSERVEMLVAALNATLDGRSDSFVDNFLEVLQSIPAFEDLAVQYTTSKQPEQESDSGNGKGGSDHSFDNVQSSIVGPLVELGDLQYGSSTGINYRHQGEYLSEIQVTNINQTMAEKIKGDRVMHLKVKPEAGQLAELQKKDEGGKKLKHELNATEQRAERAVARQENNERSALRTQVLKLQNEVKQLREQLCTQKQLRCNEDELPEVTEKLDRISVTPLQQEKPEHAERQAERAEQQAALQERDLHIEGLKRQVQELQGEVIQLREQLHAQEIRPNSSFCSHGMLKIYSV